MQIAKTVKTGLRAIQGYIPGCVILLISLSMSCNKDDSSIPIIENVGEPVEIKIIPSGISLYGSVTEAGQDNATRSAATRKERVHFLEDFDEENMLETIIEAVPEEVVIPTRGVNLTNTTMRVVVCNSAGNIVAQCVYNVTNGMAIPQDGQGLFVPNSSTAYTFHCYSPANAIDTDTKKVTVNAGDNFAYNKVTQVINSNSGAVTITIPVLTPMVSKIKYVVTSPEFAGVITCTGSVKGLFGTGATWTLGSAEITCSGSELQTLKVSENNGEIVVIPTGTGTDSLQVTIADLKIEGVAKECPTLPKVKGITLQAGLMYTVKISIKRKTYSVSEELQLRVAKGNLMFSDEKWHLTPDEGWSSEKMSEAYDMFCWGIPVSIVQSNNTFSQSIDALSAGCTEVLGEGWRVPSNDDLFKFEAQTNRVWARYPSSNGYKEGMFWGTTDSLYAETHYQQLVFLPMTPVFGGESGWYAGVSPRNEFEMGYYWSSTQYGGDAPPNYKSLYAGCLIICRGYDKEYAVVSPDFWDSDTRKRYGKAIRCVSNL